MVSLEQNIKRWLEGNLGLPTVPPYMMDAFQRASYLQGKRSREATKAIFAGQGASERQTLGEAIYAAFGLAGTAAGILLGLQRVGSGEGTWPGVAGWALAGLAVGTLVLFVPHALVRRLRRSLMWRRGAEDRDGSTLIVSWHAVFGSMILPHLLMEIEGEGRGWAMDKKGGFWLRTRRGNEFFVGPDKKRGGTKVEAQKKVSEEDLYLMALIHRSLGHETVRSFEGSRKNRRTFWAAARIAGVEVEGYTPDPKAIEVYQAMMEDERFIEVPSFEEP